MIKTMWNSHLQPLLIQTNRKAVWNLVVVRRTAQVIPQRKQVTAAKLNGNRRVAIANKRMQMPNRRIRIANPRVQKESKNARRVSPRRLMQSRSIRTASQKVAIPNRKSATINWSRVTVNSQRVTSVTWYLCTRNWAAYRTKTSFREWSTWSRRRDSSRWRTLPLILTCARWISLRYGNCSNVYPWLRSTPLTGRGDMLQLTNAAIYLIPGKKYWEALTQLCVYM